MNKKYIIAVLFTCSVFASKAQLHYLSLGAKGGISIPGIQNNNINPVLSGYQSQLAWQGGLVLQIPVNKNWSVVSGIDYMPITAQKDGDQIIPQSAYAGIFAPGFTSPSYLYSNFKSNLIINYLQLPVLAEYNFNSQTAINFFVQAGLFMGVPLNGNITTEGQNIVYVDAARTRPFFPARLNLNQRVDVSSFVQTVNWGFQGAAGIKYNSQFATAFLQAAASSGAIPIQKNEADGKNKTGALLVSVGFLVHLYN